MNVLAWLVVIGLALLAIWIYWRFFKVLKIKNIVFVDGALGTGKSFFSVALAVRLYKKQLRIWKLKKFLFPILGVAFKRFQNVRLEKPRLYSNINLRNVEFVHLNRDLMFRQQRFAYKSVVLIDEFSLMADQFTYKDREMSERLSLFFKLFRHETMGGYCVINSQSTSDLHYSLKYVLSDYLYIHHKSKFPFVTALCCQEMAYCGDANGMSVMNVRDRDVEESCKTMLVLNKYYKYYDSYCYSIFTDSCPVYKISDFHKKGENIKDENLVTFKTFLYLTENLKKKPTAPRPKGDA